MKQIIKIESVFGAIIIMFMIACNHINSDQDLLFNRVIVPRDMDELYKELGFKYSSVSEAEDIIIDKLDSLYAVDSSWPNMFHKEFITLLKNDPATMDYEFIDLQSKGYINLISSEDGNLKFYFWDTGMGGREGSFYNICQYRYNNDVYYYEGSLDELVIRTMKKNIDIKDQMYLDNCISKIHTIESDNGQVYYLVCTYRDLYEDHFMDVIPLSIENRRLKLYGCFPIRDLSDTEEFVRCYSNLKRHTNGYFSVNDAGNHPYSYDYETQTLYIPEIIDYEYWNDLYTDRYTLYHFDGMRLVNKGKDAGYWLHESLKDFKMLDAMFLTEDYRVRIDKLDDDSYRYSSWKLYKDMWDKPDIIIYNGKIDEEKNIYTFDNEGYQYKIFFSHEIPIISQQDMQKNSLSIYRNEKRILYQEEIDEFYNDEIEENID